MTKRFSPLEMVRQARAIAKDYHLRIVEKSGRYSVYRIVGTRAVFVGARARPESLRIHQ